jgi:hypothetical protein
MVEENPQLYEKYLTPMTEYGLVLASMIGGRIKLNQEKTPYYKDDPRYIKHMKARKGTLKKKERIDDNNRGNKPSKKVSKTLPKNEKSYKTVSKLGCVPI